MTPLILAASLIVSLTASVPTMDDTCSVCSHPKPVPGHGDSVRVTVFVWPQGMYFRAWRDTLYFARGQSFTYTHAAAANTLHTATLTTARHPIVMHVQADGHVAAIVDRTRWIESRCPRGLQLVPKVMQ